MVEPSAAPEAIYHQLAQVGKALSSAKRLELIEVLAQGERTVESLAQATSLKTTTASAHLQSMYRGGLVTNRKSGTHVYYSISGHEVLAAFVALRELALTRLAAAERARLQLCAEDEMAPLPRADLLTELRGGRCIVLDVRPAVEFDAGHIVGARSLPWERLPQDIDTVPDTVDIVAYGRSAYCPLPFEAVRLLRSKGTAARRLDCGFLEWRFEYRPSATGAG
ncbi:metalloregulator ArsR/SmtB family transcription factor [Haloechinothrix sp. LS1_15]|uniref:ArsR/SmtB family transcription factor n=1 Tax=Haloechinothrix sp. LS1_15 TaxID=2652248 RepID=UPI0029465F26|nr:metalloregulator ArsR/SmtB family transcription factor [Haloechinothrix sp. LS1_15]MDV6012437.1 metalloregulator ArsR/SmtB family transcription factor [Haloechinothrix sp. LS1_15]